MGFPSFQFDPQAIAAREGFDIGPSFLETGLNALKFDMKNKLGLIGKPLDKLDFSGISMFEANAYYVRSSFTVFTNSQTARRAYL